MSDPEVDATFFAMMDPIGLELAARDDRAAEIRDRYQLSKGNVNSEDIKRVGDLFAAYGQHPEITSSTIGEFVLLVPDQPEPTDRNTQIIKASTDREIRSIVDWLDTTDLPDMERQNFEERILQLICQKYELPPELSARVWEMCRRDVANERQTSQGQDDHSMREGS